MKSVFSFKAEESENYGTYTISYRKEISFVQLTQVMKILVEAPRSKIMLNLDLKTSDDVAKISHK